jgi:hypothetical protein
MPLGLYSVRWTSNLNDVNATWYTLSNNVTGTGGPVQVTDVGTFTNATPRFYRVQTPP